MPLRFTLRQLEYFVAVGESGSIALAAERVHVSSPSISTAVSQLEKEFGLALFVRKHAQGVTLTQAGARMMVQARKLLAEAGELNDLAGTITGHVRGPLSIGCLLTFAQLVVPGVRRTFETEYPEVRIRQFELDQTEIFAALRHAEIDVALTYDLDIPADLEFHPLVELPPYVLVGETHPLAALRQVSVAELEGHPMVLLDLPGSSGYFASLFTDVGVRANVVERTRDMAVMRSLVANGFGYSIANVRPVNERSPDGRALRFIPLTSDSRALNMGLVLAAGARSLLNVKAFIDHCRSRITPERVPGVSLASPDNSKGADNA